MRYTDLDSAAAEFLTMARQLRDSRDVPADRVVEEWAHWYRDVRIEEAPVNESNDRLILEWGAMGVKDLAEPTDFRPPATYEGVQYAPTRYRAIRLTREVYPAAGHEDPQFDRLAVDLSVTLCFEPVAEEERGGETSMDGPEEVDFGLWDFREEPYVQPLLIVPPQRIVATIAGAG